MFLKVEGFDGDVTERRHEKWSQVTGYKHAVRVGGADGDPRAGVGRPEHDPLLVLKSADRSSAGLFEAAQEQRTLRKVELDVCRPSRRGGGEPACFLRITLTEASIVGYAQSDSQETLRFSYHKIQWRYQAFDLSTDVASAKVDASWDVTRAQFNTTGSLGARDAIGFGRGSGSSYFVIPDAKGESVVRGFEDAVGLNGFARDLSSGLILSKGTDTATPILLAKLHVGEVLKGKVHFGCREDQGNALTCAGVFDVSPSNVVELSYGASQVERVKLVEHQLPN